MGMQHEKPGAATPPRERPWKTACTHGGFCGVMATIFLLSGLREFTPPREEPASVEAFLEDYRESRSPRELVERLSERSRRNAAIHREKVARAAAEWERTRIFIFAFSAGWWLWAGWLLWRAYLLYAHQPAPPPSLKLAFYLLNMTVCVGVLLFGIFGADRYFDAEDGRVPYVELGLLGLCVLTPLSFNAARSLFGSATLFPGRPRPDAPPDRRGDRR